MVLRALGRASGIVSEAFGFFYASVNVEPRCHCRRSVDEIPDHTERFALFDF